MLEDAREYIQLVLRLDTVHRAGLDGEQHGKALCRG